MMRKIPWYFIVLDVIGAIFLVVAILALTGTDFGYPVLRETAPVFLVVGLLLMAPLLIWVVQKRGKH